MSTLLTAAAALAALVAADPVARPVDALSDPEPPVTASALGATPEAPPATADIRALLRARHTSDLPDRSVLDAHAGAEAALQWLAHHGETLVEAERAAMSLALYPTTSSRTVCLALLEGQGHAKVRAGAARCLATQQGEAVPGALVRVLQDADMRVALAGAIALRNHPDAIDSVPRDVLDRLPPAVRDRLKETAGPTAP